ncbi:MAG: RdgB/HAM1 family non-canonical purine NTP pyrophosphatase [Candidatus Neomarinimicrobiota bacterium]
MLIDLSVFPLGNEQAVMDMEVILATRNRDKARELKALLDGSHMEGLALDDIDPEEKIPEIEESGSSLRENAFIKARRVFSLTRRPTIGDDTGLEVDALNGAPGIFSARYAGDGCSYKDNVRKLLSDLVAVPPKRRTARFRTAVCYVDGQQELWVEGVVEGMITEKPVGDRGFGYDPVFYIPEYDKTYAQLSGEEKNRWSHRGKAMRKLSDLLSQKIVPSEKPS